MASTTQQFPGTISPTENTDSDVLFVNHDRVAYRGLLGAPVQRVSGSFSIYFSLDRPFRISQNDTPWQHADLIVVAPDAPHHLMSDDRRIGVVTVEQETVDHAYLPPLLQTCGRPLESPATLNQMRMGLRHVCHAKSLTTSAFDELFFSQSLTPRKIDHRIATVSDHIRTKPYDLHDAESCASLAHLSLSRFLHLFKAELGVSFRRYRAWKRARCLLQYVRQERSLTDIALALGYPDSTHFSHSIRSVYGLRPKDIFAGSRRLSVIADETELNSFSLAA